MVGAASNGQVAMRQLVPEGRGGLHLGEVQIPQLKTKGNAMPPSQTVGNVTSQEKLC